MSQPVVIRHFYIPATADFTTVIQGYINGVSSLTVSGTVSFAQATRFNGSGFFDQQYDMSTVATASNDASIASFIDGFMLDNPDITFDTTVESATQGF